MPAPPPSPASRCLLAAAAWAVSELLAIVILALLGCFRFSAEEFLCTLAGPLAIVTAAPRFKYHSSFAGLLTLLIFALLAALPLLHLRHPRRWTLALSLLAWLVWPWIGFAFTIHHV